eukprot:UC1_evm1s394
MDMLASVISTVFDLLSSPVMVFNYETTTGVVALSGGAAYAVTLLIRRTMYWARVRRGLSDLPMPSGRLPLFGHALQLAFGQPWNIMEGWVKAADYKMLRIDFMGETGVVVSRPELLRQVLNTKQRNYGKDIQLSYKAHLDILGNGLVTSGGEHWKRQRNLLSAALRIEILEETGPVAKRAVDRLSAKLEAARLRGESVEIAEEFRVLTLQVIGELILSLTPEEASSVFPDLYLPIVSEAALRIWQPWRAWLPTPGWFKYNRTVRELNKYMKSLLRRRWSERQARQARGETMKQPDILERVLGAISPSDWGESTVNQLCDEIKTFILAGHETSASMLTWAVYQLSLPSNKQSLERARAEAKSVFSEGGRASSAAA